MWSKDRQHTRKLYYGGVTVIKVILIKNRGEVFFTFRVESISPLFVLFVQIDKKITSLKFYNLGLLQKPLKNYTNKSIYKWTLQHLYLFCCFSVPINSIYFKNVFGESVNSLNKKLVP